MTKQSTLSELTRGQKARVIGYQDSPEPYRQKLLALGLTRNVNLQVKKMAPLGDPIEIEVRGYRLSLRKKEASTLLVEIL